MITFQYCPILGLKYTKFERPENTYVRPEKGFRERSKKRTNGKR